MSAVMLLRDPDPARRRRGLAAADAALRRMGFEPSSIEHGAVGLAWGTYPGAPVQQAPGVFVLGDVIPGPGPERLDARGYAERCAGAATPPVFDGLYLAVTFDERGAFTLAVDLLGNFPIYSAVLGERVFAASSPALITAQEGFHAELDPLGLTAVMVTNGPFRGRTPLRGVRRLAPGHALTAAPGEAPREALQYAVPVSDESHDVPAEECAQRVHEALVLAAKRHVPAATPHSMLLSGGLDSRLITGVLVRQGVPVEAITRGDPTDLEYRCAHGVARHLGIPHRLVPHADGTFEHFERALWWEGMDSARASGGSGGLAEALRHARPFVVSGYMADSVFGAVTAGKAFDRTARRSSADWFIGRLNVWGVSLDVLPRLMRRDAFGDSLTQTLDELRGDFMKTSDTWMRRAWLFDLAHRQRFIMGRVFARIAERAWPRAPQLDREVLRVSAGVPMPLIGKKRLERDVLERFHAGLARVPLDRNDPDTTPLLPGAMDLIRAGLDRRIRRFRERIGLPRPEQRYYHRTFDFNGATWRRTRLGAGADRERLYALFDREVLDGYLPAAGAPWQPTGLIEGAAGVKMLTALGVWMRVGLD